jgi:hypothetical protein
LSDTYLPIPVQIKISRIDYTQNVTQSEYTSSILNYTTQTLGIDISDSEAVLSQRPAHQLIATLPGDELRPKTGVLQVWSVKDNTVYNIMYMADTNKFSRYLPIVKNMIDSFQVDHWTEPANAQNQ